MPRSMIERRRLQNLLQTVALLGGMSVLLALLGWELAGFAWIVWITTLGITVLLFSVQISPGLVLRIYGARPLGTGEVPILDAIVAELAQRAQLPAPPRLFYVPSRVLQAFTVILGGAPVIAVTDGLLRHLDPDELAGVLAHEISHIRHGDLRTLVLADLVTKVTRALAGLGLLLLIVNLPILLVGGVAISWSALLLLVVAPPASTLLQLALSRTREFDADLGAAELTGDPETFSRALQKLEHYQGPIWEQIFLPGYRLPAPSLLRTHPATSERVDRLLSLPRGRHLSSLTRFAKRGPSMPPVLRTPSWRRWGYWH
jgi:heat shock protein HtpX